VTTSPHKEKPVHETHDRAILPLSAGIALLLIGALLLWPSSSHAGIVKRIDGYAYHAQHCQRITDRDRRPTPTRRLYARSGPGEFRSWAFRLWRGRARDSCGKVRYLNADPVRAIRYVFRRVGEAAKAISVVDCETGGAFNTTASNGGVYLGLFQMGPYARARYGHSWDALGQTWSAYFYYRAAGWGPWECA
jgi:hypothetical protein